MRRIRRVVLGVLLLSLGGVGTAGAVELRGSRASILRQNGVAKEHGYTFLATPAEVRARVEEGELVELEAGGDYELAGVRYPFARREVRLFIERLSAQYRRVTGERLVVTSLTRPRSSQPANASPLSVHPAGMAVDLRVPAAGGARRWLEATLLSLESRAVLDVTRERRPPHYHVAVFPEAYGAYVEARRAAEAAEAARHAAVLAASSIGSVLPSPLARAGAGRGAGDAGRGGTAAVSVAGERGEAPGRRRRKQWLSSLLAIAVACAAGPRACGVGSGAMLRDRLRRRR